MRKKLTNLIVAGVISLGSMLNFGCATTPKQINPDNSIGYEISDSRKKVNFLKESSKFLAGAITGLGIHESSHYLTGKIYGMNPKFDIKNSTKVDYKNYEDKNDSQKAIVNGSGIIGQTLTTETILGTKKIPKDSSYILGVLAFTIVDNLRYGLFPKLRDESDVRGLKENGINEGYVRGALLAHSALSMYRLLKNEEFNEKFNFLVDYNNNKDRLEFKVRHKF